MQDKPVQLRLSVSKSKTFSDCKAKYKFSYIQNLPKKDWDFFTVGKHLHRILELFHQYYLDGSTDGFHKVMEQSFNEATQEYKDKLKPEMITEAYSIIDKYLKILYRDKEDIKNILAVEKKFEHPISDKVMLNGMIDVIRQDPDGWVNVCDYKTTKDKKYLKNDFLQLLTYAYIIHQENPEIKKIRGSYILLRHNFEYLTKDFTMDEILYIKDKYEQYAFAIENEKEFLPSPTRMCRFCDFLDHCDAGKKLVQPNSFKIVSGITNW